MSDPADQLETLAVQLCSGFYAPLCVAAALRRIAEDLKKSKSTTTKTTTKKTTTNPK
jgi:hypothetical protein